MITEIKILGGIAVPYDATVSKFETQSTTPCNMAIRVRVLKTLRKSKVTFLERHITGIVLEEKLFEMLTSYREGKSTMTFKQRQVMEQNIKSLTARYAGYKISR